MARIQDLSADSQDLSIESGTVFHWSDSLIQGDLSSAQARADEAMYRDKRAQHSSS